MEQGLETEIKLKKRIPSGKIYMMRFYSDCLDPSSPRWLSWIPAQKTAGVTCCDCGDETWTVNGVDCENDLLWM